MKQIPEALKPKCPRSMGRKRQIETIPGVFDYETMLYIGANTKRIELIDLFYAHEYAIDVIEAWEPNFKALVEWNKKWKIFENVYLNDVRFIDVMTRGFKFANLKRPGSFRDRWDIIIFWHGPEHLPRLDVAPTLEALECHANHLVIVGCPRGEYKQLAVGGNPFEEHDSYLYEKDFQDLGYLTDTLKPQKPHGSNIMAWKKVDEKKEAK